MLQKKKQLVFVSLCSAFLLSDFSKMFFFPLLASMLTGFASMETDYKNNSQSMHLRRFLLTPWLFRIRMSIKKIYRYPKKCRRDNRENLNIRWSHSNVRPLVNDCCTRATCEVDRIESVFIFTENAINFYLKSTKLSNVTSRQTMNCDDLIVVSGPKIELVHNLTEDWECVCKLEIVSLFLQEK